MNKRRLLATGPRIMNKFLVVDTNVREELKQKRKTKRIMCKVYKPICMMIMPL